MKSIQYPLLFTPVYKNYLWGGNRISKLFNRNLDDGIYAESWEISAHKDGLSIIENGYYKNESLKTLIEQFPKEIIGYKNKNNTFPILIKIIDAKKKLSIQVHPNNDTAKLCEGEPKTEMWYMLGEKDAYIYCDLKKDVSQSSFIESINNNTVEEQLERIPVKKDDAVLINGGTLHSIDENCLILEIQQSSNTTYRVYDWNRKDENGRKRELHIDKALQVINWKNKKSPLIKPKVISDTVNSKIIEIATTPYFKLEKIIIHKEIDISSDGGTFHALFVLKGSPTIIWGDEQKIDIPLGRSVLIPACMKSYKIIGDVIILKTLLP